MDIVAEKNKNRTHKNPSSVIGSKTVVAQGYKKSLINLPGSGTSYKSRYTVDLRQRIPYDNDREVKFSRDILLRLLQ